jgi:hypothetical protein
MRACRGKRRRNGHGGIRYWCSSNAKNAANLPEPSQKCQDKVSLLVGCLALLPSFPLNSKLVQKKISLQWFDMNQHLCLAKMRKKERFSVFFFPLVVLLFHTWFIYHYFFYFKYLILWSIYIIFFLSLFICNLFFFLSLYFFFEKLLYND